MKFENPVAAFLESRNPARASLKRNRTFVDFSALNSEAETPVADVGASDHDVTSLVGAAEEEDWTNVATVSSSPVKVLLLPDDGEEEEEELRLLLGDRGKVFVRPKDPPVRQESSTDVTSEENDVANVSVDVDDKVKQNQVSLGDVLWEKLSNADREELAERFEQQFLWELSKDVELACTYQPFFTSKTMRLIQDGVQSSQFLPPKILSRETTNSPDGYVLRPYQFDGVQFLVNRFHSGMPSVLGDDMGLGKTAQVSAFLNGLKTLYNVGGPHLIVVPLNTVTGWVRELSRWAPTLHVVSYNGDGKERAMLRGGRGSKRGVFVTTPAILRRDRGFFCKRSWVVAVVDEAHMLKESTATISHVARRITACFRLAMTGTPIQNSVKEVWSIMMFLYPSFCALYERNGGDTISAANNCAKLLQHVMLRRTKSNTDLGIPPRVDEPVIMVEPTRIQRALLLRMTERALREDGGVFQNHLAHQRVICSHPLALRLLTMEGRDSLTRVEDRLSACGISLDERSIIAPSGKMIELDRMLREFHMNGHRCLIFSNFTCVLDLLQGLCILRDYSHERIDGSAQRVERELSMARFNGPASKVFVFLISTMSGGVGITLTGADIVILFDANFNPQMDRQAADRAHRIGQTRTVRVFRLCCKETVEERIQDIALRRLSLGEFVVDGAAVGDDNSATEIPGSYIQQLFSTSTSGENREEHWSVGSKDHRDGLTEEQQGMKKDDPVVIDSGAGEGVESAQVPFVSPQDQSNTEDDAIVNDILRMEAGGASTMLSAKPIGRVARGTIGVTHECFVCGEGMRPLQPLFHCSWCTKAYHAECANERVLPEGVSAPRNWTCPRHRCDLCEKVATTDGALFMCYECPAAFCFDCLDKDYLDLDNDGVNFLHIHRNYPGMETEGMDVRRNVYYIRCFRCSGVLSSSSTSVSGSTEGDTTSIDGSFSESH